jgi:hypothetical protein
MVKNLLTVVSCMGLAAATLFADVFPVGSLPSPGITPPGTSSGNDPSYVFTIHDALGDAGFGTLVGSPSTGDSILITSGTLDITSSQNSNIAVGVYSLIPAGPGVTVFTAYPGEDFVVDNLLYPNNDAVSISGCGGGPPGGDIDVCGLYFGNATDTVNLFGGNGSNSNDLLLVSNGHTFVVNQSSGVVFTLTPVPEPSAIALLATTLLFALRRRRR